MADAGDPGLDGPAGWGRDDLPVIAGRHLRYLLVLVLDRVRRPMSLPELDAAVRMAGFTVAGPPGKAASDALRWAVRHGTARRVGRGTYAAGAVTKQTRHRYRQRVSALRACPPHVGS